MQHLRIVLLALLIPVMAHAAPVGERLQAALTGPLSAEPARKNVSTGTTLLAAVDTANGKVTSNDIQIFTVTNMHASQFLCFGTIPFVAGDTCNNALCATAGKWTGQGGAAAMNCTANDASQGSIVLPGTQREFKYDGTRCACIVASGAGTTTQVERVVR